MVAFVGLLSACGGGGGGSGSVSGILEPEMPQPSACLSNFADGASHWEQFENDRGTLFYTSNGGGVLNHYDFSTSQFQVIGGLSASAALEEISPSSTGRYVRYARKSSSTFKTFVTVDVTTAQESTIQIPAFSPTFTWAPDDNSFFWTIASFGPFEIGSPVAANGERIIVESIDMRAASWSADGSVALLAGDVELMVVNARSGMVLQRVQASTDEPGAEQFYTGYARLSPDGSKLAFVRFGASGGVLHVLDVGTGAVREVSPASGELSWSPSSGHIAFGVSNGHASPELALYAVATDTLEALADGYYRFSWAPARDLLAYSGPGANEQGRLTIRSLEEDNLNTLAFPIAVFDFAWSPDSRYVAFLSDDENQTRELWVADPANNCMRTVDKIQSREQGVSLDTYSWSPSGKYLFYLAANDANEVEYNFAFADGSEIYVIDALIQGSPTEQLIQSTEWLPTADVLFFAESSTGGAGGIANFNWLNVNSMAGMSIDVEDPESRAIRRVYWLRP